MSRDNEVVDAGERLEIDIDKPMPIFYTLNIYREDIEWDSLKKAFCDYQYLEIDFAKISEESLLPQDQNNIKKLISLISELDKGQISITLLEIKNCITPDETKQFEQLITCLKGTKIVEITHDKCKFHNIEKVLTEVWAYNNGIKHNIEEMSSIGDTIEEASEEYCYHTFSSSYS